MAALAAPTSNCTTVSAANLRCNLEDWTENQSFVMLTSARLCARVSVHNPGVQGQVDTEQPDHGAATGDTHGGGLALHHSASH